MMQENGFWILDASGYAFQASPDKRYWILATGYWMTRF
jgi:hypothetical protein